MSTINETLIRDVVAEVLGRLGQTPAATPAPTPGRSGSCGCGSSSSPSGGSISQGSYGVFQDAGDACAAAHAGFLQLKKQGMEARAKVVDIIKSLADANSVEWGRIELEETKIGRLDHKIEKLQIVKLVPGVEWLRPDARSGDHGITLEEYTPFGVIAAITPSTHSIPTLSGNIVNMVAAGNAVVFNAHPTGARCAATAVRAYNQAIERELGIQNLITIVEQPTLESFKAICAHEAVRLLCVTGGPAVVKAAMQTGKRAICAMSSSATVSSTNTSFSPTHRRLLS